MTIKTFEDKKREKEEEARDILNKLDDEDIVLKEANKLKNVLKNSYEVTKKEVVAIALTAAEIKEVGLEPEHPIVEEWTKKELGIGSDEFGEILNNVETAEEVKRNILEKMEAPNEIIKEVIESKDNKVKTK